MCAVRAGVRAAAVDTRGPNDGLHFHGCIGKNHSSISVPAYVCGPLCAFGRGSGALALLKPFLISQSVFRRKDVSLNR